MAHVNYYSPRLERPLISRLYHRARALGVPMTILASRLVGEGLSRLEGGGESLHKAVVREEERPSDPGG